ncbi:MAG: DUF501 domain-containing protein [Candidatus Wallbacteria bacterium]|nr:DUF501 domain-containing protein [Candidatus Wallbacteria bacterium]
MRIEKREVGSGETPRGSGSQRRVSEEDRAAVLEALGRLRYEPLAVVDRSDDGRPRVVLGFFGRGISKTAYWLTCPDLSAEVAGLESKRAIARYEAELAADPSLWAAFLRSQELYRRMLYTLFRRELPEVDPTPYLRQVRGVAGVGDARFLKCLHAHVAFTLATGRGPAGAMALSELGYARGGDGRWRKKLAEEGR